MFDEQDIFLIVAHSANHNIFPTSNANEDIFTLIKFQTLCKYNRLLSKLIAA